MWESCAKPDFPCPVKKAHVDPVEGRYAVWSANGGSLPAESGWSRLRQETGEVKPLVE